MATPLAGASVAHTQESVGNLGFDNITEHKTISSAGGRTYHYFKVKFGAEKEMGLVIPSGPKLEAMVQMIHTLGEQTKHLSPAEFKKFIDDHKMEQIHLGAHDNKDGSFETTIYRVGLHGTTLIPLFPDKKGLLEINKEDQEFIKTFVKALEAPVQSHQPAP